MYEWLVRFADDVPEGDAERREWLAPRQYERFGQVADRFREVLVKWYGEERGAAIRTAETLMVSQYGRALPDEQVREVLPFM